MTERVVCVDDSNFSIPEVCAVVKGQIYTIRERFNHFGRDGVLLHECHTDKRCSDGTECGYYASRFRPIHDISIFHEIDQEVFEGVDA